MAYSKQTWLPGISGATAFTAARMQHMEDGIEAAAAGGGGGGDIDGGSPGGTGSGDIDGGTP